MSAEATPAVEPYRAFTIAEVLESFELHEGVRIAGVGEDGDTLILGQPDEPTCWSAFEKLTGEADAADHYDLRRVQVAFANHSEGCEAVECSCEEDDTCELCREGRHEECTDSCLCADDYEHDRPAKWPCACDEECYCDEYGWWVGEVAANGEPATWVSYSYKKARARHQEAGRG